MTIEKTEQMSLRMVQFTTSEDGELDFVVPWRNTENLYFLRISTVLVILIGLFIWFNRGLTIETDDPLGNLGILTMVLIIVAMFARSLVNLVNKRYIRVTKDSITVFDGPYWTTKEINCKRETISNLVVKRRVLYENKNTRTVLPAKVFVRTTNQVNIIICETPTLQDALFIENTIEKYYGIEDNTKLDYIEDV